MDNKQIPNAEHVENIINEFVAKTGKNPNILLLPYAHYRPELTWLHGMEVGLTSGKVAVVGNVRGIQAEPEK